MTTLTNHINDQTTYDFRKCLEVKESQTIVSYRFADLFKRYGGLAVLIFSWVQVRFSLLSYCIPAILFSL